MRNRDLWRPTKFVLIDGRLRGDPTGAHLSVSSRIAGDLAAGRYQEAIESCARGRLLDLGCGNAPLFGVYAGLVDEVVCVDWPASFHAKRHVDIFADLTQPLPLSDASFDTILLTDVLEHIPNAERLLAEIARVLRPAGSLLIGVPFLYALHETPYDFNRFTRYQLERLLKNVGLDLVALAEVGGSPEVLADVMSKTLARWPRLARAFVGLASWLLRRRAVRSVSEQSRSLFPITYVLTAKKRTISAASASALAQAKPISACEGAASPLRGSAVHAAEIAAITT
jgi:SAM-dependent methyltransferase